MDERRVQGQPGEGGERRRWRRPVSGHPDHPGAGGVQQLRRRLEVVRVQGGDGIRRGDVAVSWSQAYRVAQKSGDAEGQRHGRTTVPDTVHSAAVLVDLVLAVLVPRVHIDLLVV